MQDAIAIPLFPLQLVVLPTERVPLHIFEERYREMIADCEAAAAEGGFAEFGIVYVDEEDRQLRGCCLEITRILERLPDGRTNLIATGTRRFEILGLVDDPDTPYAQALVRWIADEEEGWDDELATGVFNLHRQLLQCVQGEPPADEAYSHLATLSFTVGQACGLDPADKQILLELRSENARLRRLAEHLVDLVPRLKAAEALRQDIHQKWQLRNLPAE